MRIIVAQTDPSRLVRGPTSADEEGSSEPLPVGVVRWSSERISVLVKATYRFSAGQSPVVLAAKHAAITADDLVAFKPMTDVVLTGHAYAPSAQPCIRARVRIGEVDRVFSVVGAASDRLPLGDEWIRAADGASSAAPVGPCERTNDVPGADLGPPAMRFGEPKAQREQPDELASDDEGLTWEDLDDPGDLYRVGGVSIASPEQRSAFVEADAPLSLDGLCEGGEACETRLPAHTPVVVVETSGAWYELDMFIDTLAIDSDASTVTLTWRGQCPHNGLAHIDIERMVVTLEEDDADDRPLGLVYRELQRGTFAYALEESDFDEEAEKPLAEEVEAESLLAKYETFDLSPNPTIELEKYTMVSVALAAGQERNEVLKRHDLDEDAWLLEEQAWVQRLTDAIGHDDSLVHEHQRLVQAMKQDTGGRGV